MKNTTKTNVEKVIECIEFRLCNYSSLSYNAWENVQSIGEDFIKLTSEEQTEVHSYFETKYTGGWEDEKWLRKVAKPALRKLKKLELSK